MNLKINKAHNFKIASWNVAGLRALTKKGGMEYFNYEKPDIICLQVTLQKKKIKLKILKKKKKNCLFLGNKMSC